MISLTLVEGVGVRLIVIVPSTSIVHLFQSLGKGAIENHVSCLPTLVINRGEYVSASEFELSSMSLSAQ